jgi:hypothetical protein
LQEKTNAAENKIHFKELVDSSQNDERAIALRLKKDLEDLTWTSRIKEAYDHDENLLLMVKNIQWNKT